MKFTLSGYNLKNTLENGINMWPKYDGRWPQVSGLKFKFDPRKPANERIIDGSLTNEEGDPILMDKQYTLATKYYISTGKDGYSSFLDPGVKMVGVPDDYITI